MVYFINFINTSYMFYVVILVVAWIEFNLVYSNLESLHQS